MVSNKGLVFKKPPQGVPVPGEHIAVESREVDITSPPPPGGLITRNCFASFDPYQRVALRAPEDNSHGPPFPLGQPITGRAIAQVVSSGTDEFKKGDVIRHVLPIEEYSVLDAAQVSGAEKLDAPSDLDPKLFIGGLDWSGLTAYSSLLDIGQPKAGETIFISAAAGAVGSLVGQIAKIHGLKVFGSAGSDEKATYLTEELGFDGAFNYKKETSSTLLDALKRLAPEGFDIFYDNVGGQQLDAALLHMKRFGRIVACGMISTYNSSPEEIYGVKNLIQIIFRRLTMRGFQVTDDVMGGKYQDAFHRDMAAWIRDGSLKVPMTVTDGIENAAVGWVGMLQGQNNGKAILKIADIK